MKNSSTKNQTNKLYDAVSDLLKDRLILGFNGKSLNHETCIQIYQMLFDTVLEVVQGANLKLSNEWVNYVAQDFYESVSINEHQTLDPNIFSQKAKLENISTPELHFMRLFFLGTPSVVPVSEEIKKRT